MDQDPTRVARATVSVQTISAIITGFVDAISFKAFVRFLLLKMCYWPLTLYSLTFF